MAVHSTCSLLHPKIIAFNLSFSKLFEHCGENKEEVIPRVLQNFDHLREKEAC